MFKLEVFYVLVKPVIMAPGQVNFSSLVQAPGLQAAG